MKALVCLAVAVSVIGAACGHAERAPPRTSVANTTGCATCHAVEASEWDGSLHHGSFTDADFQQSFAIEPTTFCFDCHAPQANHEQGDVAGSGGGIGCTSCHSVGSRHGDGTKTAVTTSTCTGCHEFAFPGRPEPMQATLTEHERSPFSGVACATCHLPRAADGHRDHRFDITRNPELLRAALDVRSVRSTRGVAIVLSTRNVGHSMPTGDLFRRLRVVVRAEDAGGALLGEEEILLGRRFDERHRMQIEDTRLRSGEERHLGVEKPWIAEAHRVTVEIRYERVAQTLEREDAQGRKTRYDTLFASIVLAETTLPR